MRATPIDEHFGDLVDQKKLRAFVTKKVITKNLGDLYLGNTNQLASTIQNSSYLSGSFFSMANSFSFSAFFLFLFVLYSFKNYFLLLASFE